MTKQKDKAKYTSIGGQALIEGVMMRSADKTAMCCRTPENTIATDYLSEQRAKDRLPVLGWPVIRGIVNLVESMLLGYRALMKSAELSGLDNLDDEKPAEPTVDAESEPVELAVDLESEPTDTETDPVTVSDDAEADAETTTPAEPSPLPEKKESAVFWGVLMTVASILGVGLALVLFILLPTLLYNLVNGWAGHALDSFKAVFEGLLKLAIFVVYLAVVSLLKDIKRVFMYHGAEHKTIFCYESGRELTVDNVRSFKRFHPRCGTSFMILMLLLSLLFSALWLLLFPTLKDITVLWVAIKVLTIPLLCGFGYELIRLCGKYSNPITRIIAIPGMWVQRLTTKEPDDSMIEVAIAALNAVRPEGDAVDDRELA